jgi:hypothetical protein
MEGNKQEQKKEVSAFAKDSFHPDHEYPESIVSQLQELRVRELRNDLPAALSGSLIPRRVFPYESACKRVYGKYSGAKDEHDERSHQKYVGRSCGEFVRIGKNGMKRFFVGRDVSHEHIDGQHKRNQPREQADGQQESAKKFKARNRRSREARSRQAKAGEKIRHFIEVVQLAPAALHQLDAPVQPHKKQKRMLEIIRVMAKLVVPNLCGCQYFIHGRSVVSNLFPGNFYAPMDNKIQLAARFFSGRQNQPSVAQV